MQLVSINPIIATLWVSAAFIIGIAGNVDSFSSWTLLVGLAVVPPLILMWRWNDPRQTMSETIQEALGSRLTLRSSPTWKRTSGGAIGRREVPPVAGERLGECAR
jgi:hypothetical protein